jgi:hypothetical protein
MSKGENYRAHWNFNKEKGLVDILNEHNHQRFRGQNGWAVEGWKSIVKSFNEKFPSDGFTKGQIQEKEKELKQTTRQYVMEKRKVVQDGMNLCAWLMSSQ